MVVIEDECVGCNTIFGNCLGSMCPNRNVPHLYCDECEDGTELYEFAGEQLCIECIKGRLNRVTL